MVYGPHTPSDRERMLAALGLDSVERLFDDIPAAVRADGLDLPAPRSELEVSRELAALAARNRVDLVSFLGAGVYRHHIPATVDTVISRGEFATAYTPYQPEISQGTLQAIYEFQSLLAELVGPAGRLGLALRRRHRHRGGGAHGRAGHRSRPRPRQPCRAPPRRGDDRTYFAPGSRELEELPTLADGTTDLAALEAALATLHGRWPASSSASPTPSACSSPWPAPPSWPTPPARSSSPSWSRSRWPCWRRPASTARTSPSGRASPWASPLQYGGPHLGLLAASQGLLRQVPGRLVGRTTDLEGRRAFVMTLRAREQDIRRDKAASNICTNQALCALAATTYLATLGPHGLADVAAGGAAAARRLERALADVGIARLHAAPYLNEFAVRVPGAPAVHARLLERGILAGLPLARWYPDDADLADALLLCATEVTTDEEIERLVEALRGVAA